MSFSFDILNASAPASPTPKLVPDYDPVSQSKAQSPYMLSILLLLQGIPSDTSNANVSTPYDTLWADSASMAPPPAGSGFESLMLAQDKIYVVLAVVLIIWLGIAFYLYHTDRKLSRLERSTASGISEEHEEDAL